jgi:hypothetical protein
MQGIWAGGISYINTYGTYYSRYKCVTVSLLIPKYLYGYVTAVLCLKPPCGGFRSETATWIQKLFKIYAGTPRKLYPYT